MEKKKNTTVFIPQVCIWSTVDGGNTHLACHAHTSIHLFTFHHPPLLTVRSECVTEYSLACTSLGYYLSAANKDSYTSTSMAASAFWASLPVVKARCAS